MKKVARSTFVLFLVLVILFNFVACTFQDVFDSAKDWGDKGGEIIGNIGEIIGNLGETVGNWWGETSVELDEWWGSVKETSGNLLQNVSQKFRDVTQDLARKIDEIKDSTVTALAQAIYNSQNSDNVIPVSNKTFTNIEIPVFSGEEITTQVENELFYDAESFVYKLVISLLPASYDAFVGIVDSAETGQEVLGIAYTDYSQAYRTQDGKIYYLTGFISLCGEETLSQNDINDRLEITRLDGTDNAKNGYILSYQAKAFKTHCVALGQYFLFGVNEDSQIFYEMKEYSQTQNYIDCESLGHLYSFDENRIIKKGKNDSYFTASKNMAQITYNTRTVEQIKEDLYEDFNNVTIDFSAIDIKSIFEDIKNRVQSIFSENGIVANIANLSLKDVFSTDAFSQTGATDAKTLEKWIVGTCCVLTVITMIAISLFVPQMNVLTTSIVAVVTEVFVEVILENRSLNSVDVRKVAIAGLAGAISSTLGIVGDAFVGGFTEAIFSLIDGKTFGNALSSFLNGCVIGIGFGVAFKGLSKVLGSAIDTISPNLRKNVANFIFDHQIMIGGKTATKTVVKTNDAMRVSATKAANKQKMSTKQFKENWDEIAGNQMVSESNSNFQYYNNKLNPSATKQLDGYLNIKEDAMGDFQNRSFNQLTGEEIRSFKLNRGVPDFSSLDVPEVKIKDMGTDRALNFRKANEALALEWRNNPAEIPEMYRNYFYQKYGWTTNNDYAQLRYTHIKEMCEGENLALTWHEVNINVLQLVPTELHRAISHAGAYKAITIVQFASNSAFLKNYVRRYLKVS